MSGINFGALKEKKADEHTPIVTPSPIKETKMHTSRTDWKKRYKELLRGYEDLRESHKTQQEVIESLSKQAEKNQLAPADYAKLAQLLNTLTVLNNKSQKEALKRLIGDTTTAAVRTAIWKIISKPNGDDSS